MSDSPRDVFAWDREVPKAWQDDLDRLSFGERVSRLVLHWNAGWPQEPVQRWCIYEVLPASYLDQIIAQEKTRGKVGTMAQRLLAALQGPDPRTVGRMVKDRDIGKRWVSSSLVSRMQWRVHRQTLGGYPVLAWVIEGDNGGHAWQFGRFERSCLLALNVEPDLINEMAGLWPNPGSQAYADYDQRVFKALEARDQLLAWQRALAWDDRIEAKTAPDLLDFEEKQRHGKMMETAMEWMSKQVGDAVSDIPRTMLPQWSDFQAAATPDLNAAHDAVLEM